MKTLRERVEEILKITLSERGDGNIELCGKLKDIPDTLVDLIKEREKEAQLKVVRAVEELANIGWECIAHEDCCGDESAIELVEAAKKAVG